MRAEALLTVGGADTGAERRLLVTATHARVLKPAIARAAELAAAGRATLVAVGSWRPTLAFHLAQSGQLAAPCCSTAELAELARCELAASVRDLPGDVSVTSFCRRGSLPAVLAAEVVRATYDLVVIGCRPSRRSQRLAFRCARAANSHGCLALVLTEESE